MAPASQLCLLEGPVSTRAQAPDPGADYGEVFTRRWVVDFILDLVGYTEDRDLSQAVIVEPACGTGAFLVPVVERLLASMSGVVVPDELRSCVRAYDLLGANVERARKAVAACLVDGGFQPADAEDLAERWIIQADFLLHGHDLEQTDFVVGNPPYVRLEGIPREITAAYRETCPTMRGRADIYVGFIERGLQLLGDGGALGYICADRWMRNQYGAALRQLVVDHYAVDTVVTMHDVDAFEDEVSAYPAVFVIRKDRDRAPVIADTNGDFGPRDAHDFTEWRRKTRSRSARRRSFNAARLTEWFTGGDLWPSGMPDQIALVTDLERRFPPLEDSDTGTVVGIGVATGCDSVYITDDPTLVEEDRMLPLLRAVDISGGDVNWSGGYLVNPWNGRGLVNLGDYPRLQSYLEDHGKELRGRHVARRRPTDWYRTIDRVNAEIQGRDKLVFPDLKARIHPVLDTGNYYPHHNLYYVRSDSWDLEALGGLLLSDIADLFVGTYCVRMRGGCYRFQAQYLRRIRVPAVDSLRPRVVRDLGSAFRDRDIQKATALAATLYGVELGDLMGLSQ